MAETFLAPGVQSGNFWIHLRNKIEFYTSSKSADKTTVNV